jgi:HSP20 family molecular chaperone IbpA
MTTNASKTSETTIRISEVNASEQRRRIDQAIARRANKIYESRGATGWHELEDWRQAESEVRSNFCFGLTTSIDAVLVAFNAGNFERDSLELWVAPRQITIRGKPLRPKVLASGTAPAYQEAVFRVIVLPAVVDSKNALVQWRSSFVEIHLPIVQAAREAQARARAV